MAGALSIITRGKVCGKPPKAQPTEQIASIQAPVPTQIVEIRPKIRNVTVKKTSHSEERYGRYTSRYFCARARSCAHVI
jgi:hypothetical protein